jgi:hypothetical protein
MKKIILVLALGITGFSYAQSHNTVSLESSLKNEIKEGVRYSLDVAFYKSEYDSLVVKISKYEALHAEYRLSTRKNSPHMNSLLSDLKSELNTTSNLLDYYERKMNRQIDKVKEIELLIQLNNK